MKQRVLSILVDNTAGVLSRVSGLFSRRDYNIDSVSVGVTDDPKFSRMTIVCHGEDQVLDQITKQVNKLVDVRHIKILESDASVTRELVLAKVRVNKENRQNVISIADIFRAKIIDVSPESLILEMTGTTTKINACLELLRDGNEILELARTGVTGLTRGTDYVMFL